MDTTTTLTQDQLTTLTELSARSLGDTFITFITTNILNDTLKNTFIADFQQFAPQIANEILSLSLDSNCSCANTVKLYVSIYNETCDNFLKKFIIDNNLFSVINNYMRPFLDLVNLSGKVAVTTISQWASFVNSIKYTSYGSITTALSGDNVIVFFT